MTASTSTPQQNLDKALALSGATSFLDSSFATYMDEHDPLRALRDEFVIPTRGEIAPGKNCMQDSIPVPVW